MNKNPRKSYIFTSLIGLGVNWCRTILRFVGRWVFMAAVSYILISCGPSTVNHNDIKNINSNMDMDRRGSGGGGTGDGGGGQGVFCSSEVKDPKLQGRLLVRDIYEATTNYGRTMKSVRSESDDANKITPEAFKLIVDSVKHYFGPSSKNLDFTEEKFWIDFEKRISFIKDETPLQYSQDANSPISLPQGCEIVQIAFWHELSGPSEEGTLYVNQKYWKKLDQFNKIALLAHEFFFKQARQAGYKNSDFVREKVGQLLSTEGLPTMFKEWVPSSDSRVSSSLPHSMKGFKYCTGESSEDTTARLQFYQYEGGDGLQHFVFPVLQSNSVNLSLLQGNHFGLSQMSWDLERGTDLLLFASLEEYLDTADEEDPDDIVATGQTAMLKLWLNRRELLGSYENKDYLAILKRNITQLISLKKESLWSARVNSASQVIQMSLLNPGFISANDVEEKLKSREELMTTVNNELKSRILKQIKLKANDKHFEFPHYATMTNSISILNNEISRAIKSGRYPEEFPKWNAALKHLKDLLKENTSTSSLDWSEFEFEQDVSLWIPHLLFQIKNNMYEKEAFEKLGFLNEAYLEISKRSLNLGKILIQQGDSSLIFKLTCKDYSTLFSSLTSKKEYVFPDDKLPANLEIDADAIVEIASVGPKKKDLDFFRNNFECIKENRFMGLNCDDFVSFLTDLKNGKENVVRSECDRFSIELNVFVPHSFNRGLNQICGVYRFESSKNSYLVFSEDSKKQLLLIRKIPFGLEQDPLYVEPDEHEHYE